jgi:hypothetical protein
MHHLSFFLVYYAVLLCVFTFRARSVLRCPLRLPHKTMLGSSLPPVVLFTFLCLFAHIGVQRILCFCFDFLCCRFL